MTLNEILNALLDYACKNQLCENNNVARYLFGVKIIGLLTPKPSELISQFKQYYQKNPKVASDFFINLIKIVIILITIKLKKI
ncbi:TPA: hypothetical protein ACHD77_001679 [Campylobacter jejuni]